jgi:ABC-type polysaccharide/polyol phosphate transport system ATPase subunit
MSEPAIEVKNVSISFPVVRFRPQGIKEALVSTFWRRRRTGDDTFLALKNVSLEVKKHEVLGIIGANGSGKSTLLKLIAGIYAPDSGEVIARGRMSSLLDLGAGFREELTGLENIRLNGAILGFSPKEMAERTGEIVAFSGLSDFIDQPLRTYSSGMKLRLGFAVASAIKPEILLIDEVLAVGDEEFRQRSMARIDEMVKNETTVVIVSHNVVELNRLCSRIILLSHGEKLEDGEPKVTLHRYHELLGLVPKTTSI